MATKQFASVFYAAQSASMQLEHEIIGLEKMGISSLSTVTEEHLDVEGGPDHPALLKMSNISNLIDKLAQLIAECRRLATTPIERARLTSLERIRADSLKILERFRAFLQSHNHQRMVRASLFDGVSDSQSASLLGASSTAGYIAKEGELLQNTMKKVQQSISSATASWASLQRQGAIFKEIQDRAVGAAQSLGMSQNVIGWIQRQENINSLIVIVGIVLTLIIILLFYKWWTS